MQGTNLRDTDGGSRKDLKDSGSCGRSGTVPSARSAQLRLLPASYAEVRELTKRRRISGERGGIQQAFILFFPPREDDAAKRRRMRFVGGFDVLRSTFRARRRPGHEQREVAASPFVEEVHRRLIGQRGHARADQAATGGIDVGKLQRQPGTWRQPPGHLGYVGSPDLERRLTSGAIEQMLGR